MTVISISRSSRETRVGLTNTNTQQLERFGLTSTEPYKQRPRTVSIQEDSIHTSTTGYHSLTALCTKERFELTTVTAIRIDSTAVTRAKRTNTSYNWANEYSNTCHTTNIDSTIQRTVPHNEHWRITIDTTGTCEHLYDDQPCFWRCFWRHLLP